MVVVLEPMARLPHLVTAAAVVVLAMARKLVALEQTARSY
jgi:hypothetical protein